MPDEAELVACEQTIYGGLEVSETKRLKVLEDENRRLKQLVAEQALDNRVLKELLGKPW